MEILHCYIFFVFVFIFSFSSASAADSFSEALLSLKSEFIVPSNVLNDWVIPKEQTPSQKIISCSWTGVKCNQNSTKIISLDLSFKNLGGVLSGNQFNQFPDLIDFNISYNSFSGNFPTGIFNLTSLNTLDISRNNFSSVFPVGISNLENLVVLDAFSNSFSGSLPLDVCKIPTLKVLNLAGSYFSGKIPGEYGSCKNLEILHLAGNLLSGNLPVEFGMLENIVHMEIGYNLYQSSIPFQFGNMSQLQYLDIADANLSGPIPKELGNLTKLDSLFLFKNHLSGMIPVELSKILSLSSLDLSDNLLSGPIPESFSNLVNLKLLSVMYNDMNGSVPEGLAKLPNLESLLIWDNFFSGTLPLELGKHSKLKWVDVSTNDFVGIIPPDICSGGALTRLMLFSNYFSGGLSSISNCSSLVRVRLEDNLLSGGIPSNIFHASNLEHFNVSNNPSLGGILPEKTWSLSVLQNFSAKFCNISGTFPGFELCKSLSVVELNGNHLSGTIPESVSICENLEVLDLSENNFSGEIPLKLGSSMKLRFLNLSYNDLSGSIPMVNSFKTMDSSSFIGNPNLCGAPLVKPCHHGNGISEGMELGGRKNHKVAWVLVLCAVVVVLSGFLFGIFYYRRQNVNRHWKMVQFGGLPELTAADVLKSFDSIEALETPYSSNSVYKAVLLTGITVIVRKIEWGTKSSNLLIDFISRLGNARHKNLIRLLGFCYNQNIGYLLYEYLPNGNLDEKIGIKRDWSSKHELLINIAHGLYYLHHDCHPAIPYGNLKASNIVFDDNMEPHLAEFAFKTISAMEKGEYKGLMEHELKDDIFDFGEIVLEILTNGKRKNGGINVHKTPKDVLLKEIYNENEVDISSSSSKSVQEEINVVLELVIRCTTSKISDRPSMEDVLKILLGLKPQKK